MPKPRSRDPLKSDARHAHPPDTDDHHQRILWAVDRLAELRPLTFTLTLHDRARTSDAAAQLRTTFQEGLCDRLREILRPRVHPDQLELVAKTIVALIEGLLGQHMTAAERQNLLRFLLTELTDH